jgi:hypothetical protein
VNGTTEAWAVRELRELSVEREPAQFVDGSDEDAWHVPIHLIVSHMQRQVLPAGLAVVDETDFEKVNP